MSRRDIYLYVPEVCDGDFCPMNCDHCPKRDDAIAAQEGYDEPNEADLEMGFDPYAGCYTNDC